MFLKKVNVLFLAFITFLLLVSAVSYGQDETSKRDTRSAAELKKVEEAFKKDFQNTTIRDVKSTGIDGLYEITAGSTVFYYHPKSSRLIFGDLITKDFKNLTAERRKEAGVSWSAILASKLKDLPLDKAIKIGSGKHTVVEFADIDCPYCRQMETFFKQRDDITRYVFLFPLDGLHPNASKKALAVLCSNNKAETFSDAMAGKLDNGEIKTCDDGKAAGLLDEHKEAARTMDITGTPSIWVDKTPVTGADVVSIQTLLSEKNQ